MQWGDRYGETALKKFSILCCESVYSSLSNNRTCTLDVFQGFQPEMSTKFSKMQYDIFCLNFGQILDPGPLDFLTLRGPWLDVEIELTLPTICSTFFYVKLSQSLIFWVSWGRSYLDSTQVDSNKVD